MRCCFACAALLLAACTPPAAERPNVLLLSVDTLRADRLGAFGYERDTTPALDRFAAESVVFDRAVAQAPWTLPSLASLMSGMPTTTHGCWTPQTRLDPIFSTLAEVLQRSGYDTLGVANQPYTSRQHGLHQGFTWYDDELTLNAPQVTSERVTDKVLFLLEQKAGKQDDYPWFLWAHYFDPHDQYLAHEGVSEAFGTESDEDLYDGEVRFTDGHLGRVLDALEEHGLVDDTVVIFVTDHGEEFGDHGGKQHGFRLYSELTRVPLIVFDPTRNAARRRIPEDVSTLDLLPTLREILDLPASDQDQGRSLVPAYAGTAPLPPRTLFTMRSEPEEQGGRELVGVIARGHKLILTEPKGRRELYDLGADPGETTNLARENPELADALEAEWRRFAASARRWDQESEAVTLSPEAARRLAEIGYVDGED